MTYLYWRGYSHAAGMAALTLTGVIPFIFIPRLFEHTVPQAIWIPFILALAISTVGWALLTLGASVALAVASYPGAYAEPYTVLISAMIAVLLVAARLTQERLLLDTLEAKRRAEQSAASAREAELRYRTLAAGTFEGIAVTQNDQFIDVNEQFLAMLGYTREEFTNISLRDVLPVEDQERVLPKIAGQRDFRVEHQAIRKDGHRILVEAHGQTIATGGRNLHITAIQDITQRKRAVQALAESETRFRRLFEANGCVMLLIDPSNGLILAANRAASAFYGHPPEHLIGMLATELNTVPPDELVVAWQQALSEERGCFDFHVRLASGRERDVEVYATPIEMDGKLVLFCIIHDVTDKKQADAMLLQSRKMEAIGTLAGGIAHDFNNILTSILGFNELIRGDMANRDVVAHCVEQVNAAANRAKDLVRQILAFSGQMPAKSSPIDLRQTAQEICQLVRAAAPATIEIALDLPPGRAMILATSIQLHQVLMNLCINAMDAIGKACGKITIALEHCDGGFQLSVADSGCGIPPEIQSRLFDPYFTTKGPGKGTGLGLSVVHGIVEDLGGTVTVESPAEGGARFVVRLPALAPVPAAPLSAERAAPEGSAVQSRHILVVDDEPQIAEVFHFYLAGRGHRVSATTASGDALGWIRSGQRFDVVITDHMMPGVTGIELARAVAECAPGTRVLLCSGRDDMIGDDEIAAAHIHGFLVKPFELEELAEMVERMV
jgi:PAS domain S-box-containing protein